MILKGRRSDSIGRASFILIVSLFLSNLLGLIRNHYLTQKISTDLLDVYFAAFRLPDLIFNVLVLGAIAAALIPVLSDYVARGEDESGFRLVNSFTNLMMFFVLLAVSLLWLLQPKLTPFLVPSFSLEKQALTTEVGRIILLNPLIFGFSYVFGGVLNTYKRFLAYASAPILYNLALIGSILFFAERHSIFAVAWGVIAGALLHMLIQLVAALRLGYRYRLLVHLRDPEVRKIWLLLLPRSIGLGVNQILIVAFTAIGSALGAGAIAIFQLANDVQTMPVVVFGTSVATAIFPSLTEAVSLNRREEFVRHFQKAFQAILFLMVPAAIGIILLRAQIVRVVFESGAFTKADTILTLRTLALFSISLVASGLLPLLSRGFYAYKDTRTPTLVAVVSALIGIALGYVFGFRYGVPGLALAFSLATILNVSLLYLFLLPRIKEIGPWFFFWPSLKIALSSLVMGLFVWFGLRFAAEGVNWRFFSFDGFVDVLTTFGLIVQTLFASVVGLVVYLIAARGLGSEEIEWLLNLKSGRLSTLGRFFSLLSPYLNRRSKDR